MHCVIDIGEDIEDIRDIWESNREFWSNYSTSSFRGAKQYLCVAACELRRCCEVEAV